MNNHDDVNTPVIAAIGLVAILLLVAFVLFLQVVYYQADAQQEEKAIAQQPVELIDLKTQQQARLASYAWVDAKKGTVAIPIDRAMTLVLADLTRGTKEPSHDKK